MLNFGSRPESDAEARGGVVLELILHGTYTSETLVLVANEPRSYRQAIAAVIRQLRPRVEVVEMEPDGLDAGVERLSPGLVVCSRATGRVRSNVPVWVELYPDRGARSMVSIAGKRSTVDDIQLSALLSIVDQACGI